MVKLENYVVYLPTARCNINVFGILEKLEFRSVIRTSVLSYTEFLL